MNITQEITRDWVGIDHCANCGAPLLGFDGIGAVIGGSRELFCKSECIGQRRQQQMIMYR